MQKNFLCKIFTHLTFFYEVLNIELEKVAKQLLDETQNNLDNSQNVSEKNEENKGELQWGLIKDIIG